MKSWPHASLWYQKDVYKGLPSCQNYSPQALERRMYVFFILISRNSINLQLLVVMPSEPSDLLRDHNEGTSHSLSAPCIPNSLSRGHLVLTAVNNYSCLLNLQACSLVSLDADVCLDDVQTSQQEFSPWLTVRCFSVSAEILCSDLTNPPPLVAVHLINDHPNLKLTFKVQPNISLSQLK